eukprot:CAMPEP_0119018222 /NCGR_PEP_ID=MMETSP1176-20130426/18866_1 /TAXON_ID=265551 /ORGANISM="Synedropsis recta cf, Strain CCMP1620" /LENGTH=55 /DNA_ID=CAMNT_0006972175 /DNA_START=29 /DNA_END=193 /DNA_ORIENTATION=+
MAWERITDDDYRTWLIGRQVVPEEFNIASMVDRNTMQTQFENQQQQRQRLAPSTS